MEQKEEVKQTMAEIYTQIAEREGKKAEISNITYYKEFVLNSAGFIENDIFITKLQKTKEKVNEEIKEKERSIEERNKDEDEERTPWGDAEARDARR